MARTTREAKGQGPKRRGEGRVIVDCQRRSETKHGELQRKREYRQEVRDYTAWKMTKLPGVGENQGGGETLPT